MDVPAEFLARLVAHARIKGRATARGYNGARLDACVEQRDGTTCIVVRGYTPNGRRDGTWVFPS